MNKISAVYKIVNTVTGDFYVGSSKDVEHRWVDHKCPSSWKRYSNKQLYKDFQKYGLDKFRFQILAPVEPGYLKQVEQEFIKILKPTYNSIFAKGLDVGKRKESNRKYQQSPKGRKARRKYLQSEKGKDYQKKSTEKYNNRLCLYNGEELTLGALRIRFRRAGVEHPTLEAKKYLIKEK